MSFPLPRFEAVSRRQLLQRSAIAGAAVLVPAACSHDDASILRADVAPRDTAATTEPTTPRTSAPQSSVPDTSAPPTTAATDGATFPAGAELQVSFTYQADGDRVRNPYLVVWVETPDGEMVSTVSLWLKRDKTRYLDHLTRWYDVESVLLDAGGTNSLDAVAGATRGAGDYQVVWPGTDVDGNPVAQGDYVLCVEAAREHGPHSMVSSPITFGTEAFTVTLGENAELVNVSAAYVV